MDAGSTALCELEHCNRMYTDIVARLQEQTTYLLKVCINFLDLAQVRVVTSAQTHEYAIARTSMAHGKAHVKALFTHYRPQKSADAC